MSKTPRLTVEYYVLIRVSSWSGSDHVKCVAHGIFGSATQSCPTRPVLTCPNSFNVNSAVKHETLFTATWMGLERDV